MVVFVFHILTLVAIYVMIALSLNLAMGYTGLVNFGHIGLLGAGAYTSAILMTKFEWNFWPALLAAALVSGALGALISLPSKKIKDDYFALLTLGFLFITSAIFINWTEMTRGTLGIRGITRPEAFSEPLTFFLLCFLFALFTYVVLHQIVSSPFGRVLEAIRDDELVAESLGKNVGKAKIISLSLSGVFVGIAGALLATFLRLINPGTFWLDPLVLALASVVIGGLASLRGSVAGVLLVFAVSESLRFFSIPSSMVGPLRIIIFMFALLLIILWRPKGIFGRADLD